MAYIFLIEAETLGVGKTSLATACKDHLLHQGFRVGGLLTKASYKFQRPKSLWEGQDAVLLPDGAHFPLARVDRPDWQARHTFAEHERMHPRLDERRRALGVEPAAAGRCLAHMAKVIADPSVDAIIFDEVGTILGGETVRRRDDRLLEVCTALAHADKKVIVATVQLKNQHRQHIIACVEVLRQAMRRMEGETIVLDGLGPPPELPSRLLELTPNA